MVSAGMGERLGMEMRRNGEESWNGGESRDGKGWGRMVSSFLGMHAKY